MPYIYVCVVNPQISDDMKASLCEPDYVKVNPSDEQLKLLKKKDYTIHKNKVYFSNVYIT